MKKVILYYKYTQIDDPERLKEEHIAFCQAHAIRGRVLIANEGINGTLSADPEDINAYKQFLLSYPYFSDIEFKERDEESDVFPKLKVKVRPEIVSLKADVSQIDKRGTYLEPDELQKMLQSGDEFYIVDVRNTYESFIGKFKNSIALQMVHFRELPQAVPQIEALKEKKVVTVCTGGIRCEKASAYLIKQGFTHVYQLHGGILKYGKQYPDGGFEGKCYVFDERIAIPISTKETTQVIAQCHFCKTASDTYRNCKNASCNKHFVCCDTCADEYNGTCSQNCLTIYQHARQDS